MTPDDVARILDVDLELLLCAPDSGCPRCADVRAGTSGSEHTGADAQRPGRTTALPTTDPDHAPGRLTYDPATGAGRTEDT